MLLASCHLREDMVLFTQLCEVGVGPAGPANAVLRLGLKHVEKLLCSWVGKRLQEHGVNDAENGGVGADAESECEDGNDGEAGRLAEHANGEAEVLPAGFNERFPAG